MQTRHDLAKSLEAHSFAQRRMEGLSWKCRELHVACRAHTRVLASVNKNLESRLVWAHQQLLQTVPAPTYFSLLDKHMATVREEHANCTLSQSIKAALQLRFEDLSPSSGLQQHYQDTCTTSTNSEARYCQSQVVLKNKAPELVHKVEVDSNQNNEALKAADAQAVLAHERAASIGNELASARVCIDGLQKQLASETESISPYSGTFVCPCQ